MSLLVLCCVSPSGSLVKALFLTMMQIASGFLDATGLVLELHGFLPLAGTPFGANCAFLGCTRFFKLPSDSRFSMDGSDRLPTLLESPLVG